LGRWYSMPLLRESFEGGKMKVGDLVYDYEVGCHAIIVKVIDAKPVLYKLFYDDGDTGYGNESHMALV